MAVGGWFGYCFNCCLVSEAVGSARRRKFSVKSAKGAERVPSFGAGGADSLGLNW